MQQNTGLKLVKAVSFMAQGGSVDGDSFGDR
jgi:hypothetical protein